MDKMGYAPGLIRYTTQNVLEGKPAKLLRPRVLIYAGLLATVLAGLAWSVAGRTPIALDVIRDRNQLYRESDDGRIENVYMLKILNMDRIAHEFALSAMGMDGLELILDTQRITAGPGEVVDLPVRLRAEEDSIRARSTPVTFTLEAAGGLSVTEEARFLGPAP
jgi:polyferredoxin